MDTSTSIVHLYLEYMAKSNHSLLLLEAGAKLLICQLGTECDMLTKVCITLLKTSTCNISPNKYNETTLILMILLTINT